MWYSINRFFLSLYKYFETILKIYINKRKIARAYREPRKLPAVSISLTVILWSVVAMLCIGVVFTGLLYSNKILQSVSYINEQFKKNISSEKPKTTQLQRKKSSDTVINTLSEKIVLKDTLKKEEAAAVFDEKNKNTIGLPAEMNYLIIANKANRSMFILNKKNDSWSLFRTYFMAIGEKDGIKIMKGDKRTPEGTYFIVGRKERSELHQMYGPLAFVLNYPNDVDKKNGRTGNGIWIHGTNPDSTPLMTRGCLELENTNILELGGYLKSGIGTPVIIINNDALSDPAGYPEYNSIESERKKILSQYKKQRDYFISLLEKWKNAWEAKNIEDYSVFYNEDKFNSQGLNWSAWKDKKTWTFQTYKEIEISLDKIFLADYSDTTAVLKFIQEYRSDQMQALNGKKLELVKSGEQWKIYMENTFPKEELLL